MSGVETIGLQLNSSLADISLMSSMPLIRIVGWVPMKRPTIFPYFFLCLSKVSIGVSPGRGIIASRVPIRGHFCGPGGN
jgi:hypothetical protein